ncbi:MAG: DUF885 domain-containing protein [Candidatus Eisenbacteria bacterium]
MWPKALVPLSSIVTCLLLVSVLSAQEGIFSFPTASTITKADSAFVKLSKQYFAWYYSVYRVDATGEGIHEFDGMLDDLSPSSLATVEARTPAFLKDLSAIDPASLSRLHRYDYWILKDRLEERLFRQRELKPWESSAIFYTDLVGSSLQSLLSRDFAPWPVRLRSATFRLREIPRLLDQARATLKSPSRINTQVAVKQTAGCIELITGDLKKACENAPELRDSLEVASAVAVAALTSFGTYLEKDLLPRSSTDYRLGKELYVKKLRHTLQSDYTLDQLLAMARREYEATRKEVVEICRALHSELFPNHKHEKTPAGDEEIAREVYAEIANTHVGPEELADECRTYLDELVAFIEEKDLLTLPHDGRLDVEWTPEFSRGVAIAGLESPGPMENHLPSFFQVSPIPPEWTEEQTESYLREYNQYLQKILCIHEAYPGHYVQLWYANRFPSVVRAILGSGPFVEGWAVYTERMMLAAGYGGGDPRLKLSQLKFYLRTVINTIIDIGLHTGTMSEEEAVELMTRGGFQEESEAREKIVRASLTSTQLVTYFMGLQGVVEIERLYKAKTGDAFSQKAFNEKLLSFGSPPLKYLKEMMLED